MKDLIELQRALKDNLEGDVRFDPYTRILNSTDSSNYQIEPLGVVFPRREDDLFAVMAVAADLGIPLIPRGAGTSLAGQAIGKALIVDCSRYLNRIHKIDVEERLAEVDILHTTVGSTGKIKIAYVHAAALEEVEKIKLMVEDRLNCVESLIAELSPALGVHTGPGTAGLCYYPIYPAR